MRYGPYKSNGGHLFFIDVTDGKRKSIWLHREIVESRLGRALSAGEVVHHIDGNKENNSPSNLEIMLKSEHSKIHRREVKMETFICPNCGATATKRSSMLRGNKNKGRAGPFCSRQCAGTASNGGW